MGGHGPVSIQVAATIEKDGEFEVVPVARGVHTHFSVYLRKKDGSVVHDSDHPCVVRDARTKAFVRAAHLSIEHRIYIEAMQ